MPNSRVVIFDINGEYGSAFEGLPCSVRYTVVGRKKTRLAPEGCELFRIPYFALGRSGLFRLLLPSEKTQAPALRFALQHLNRVEANANGAWPAGANPPVPVLFDDCRPMGADKAQAALEVIQSQRASVAQRWPHMRAIGCLATEHWVLQKPKGAWERNAFLYGNVQTMICRIDGLLTDDAVADILEVEGGEGSSTPLNLEKEAQRYCEFSLRCLRRKD